MTKHWTVSLADPQTSTQIFFSLCASLMFILGKQMDMKNKQTKMGKVQT